jgi:uncharacterized lipoprotein YddW (UPF0748 family)
VRNLYLLLLFFCFSFSAFSQHPSPKREFRAVWIASVGNIDWPSRKGLSTEAQQAEFRSILDAHVQTGLNAVVVQVRPAADAFYRSGLEPWSEWLMGVQGQAPSPAYDPLAFMLEESHRRGLEFHAWFNPYRATADTLSSRRDPGHITRTRPEWFLPYEGKLLFDPGLPEVRAYITQVIMDVVRRYDIDGVHFDDYFYPYPVPKIPFPDDSSFLRYAGGFTNKADWRRHNVDALIHMISDSIRATKPYVKFGISPFGVWKNQSEDPLGSATRSGAPTYSALYADTRKWLQEGWIDYVVPQVYWHIGHKLADYKTIVEWWTNNTFDRHLYIGQGPYKINHDSYREWHDGNEIPRQVRLNRSLPAVQGSVYFSSKSLTRNPGHVQDSLRLGFYRHPALVPVMAWKAGQAPARPENLQATKTSSGVALKWQAGSASPKAEAPRYYVVYRFQKYREPDLNNPQNIVAKVFGTTTHYLDAAAPGRKRYVYIVTALDRLQQESPASQPAKARKVEQAIFTWKESLRKRILLTKTGDLKPF